ncbi:glycosyltransferase family A protein [Akkermansia sp. N21169]|uniref:glycosyltransferase family 2 protein n=1 Tax=Akkermansia sp. N21169 TaxID=3040765 RepID=UPI00244E7786|nr:glycosyltransferase family A protein [Akkermansia sp. N21169]MDH3069585.1 glycosyltransferase family A protein [Akkermansia sp. N21169]
MISVIIPLYNKEQQIADTLASVLKQSFKDFEIVIVDDGSTDRSVEKAFSVRDARIRLVRQENAGVSAARNRGVEESRFDLVAFLDADDCWKPDYLQTQYELSRKYPQCDVFACNYEFVHADGSIHPTIIRKLPFEGQDGILDNYFEVASCSHPPICSISIMVRKTILQQIEGFPLDIRSGEDLLTWAKLACTSQIAYSKTVGAEFHVAGYALSDVPKRLPDPNNQVGLELQKLLKDRPISGLSRYISHWYKMRASIYMRLGMRNACICEIFRALYYDFSNYKLYIYSILILVPKCLRHKILSKL